MVGAPINAGGILSKMEELKILERQDEAREMIKRDLEEKIEYCKSEIDKRNRNIFSKILYTCSPAYSKIALYRDMEIYQTELNQRKMITLPSF